jgi:hypothetical protein
VLEVAFPPKADCPVELALPPNADCPLEPALLPNADCPLAPALPPNADCPLEPALPPNADVVPELEAPPNADFVESLFAVEPLPPNTEGPLKLNLIGALVVEVETLLPFVAEAGAPGVLNPPNGDDVAAEAALLASGPKAPLNDDDDGAPNGDGAGVAAVLVLVAPAPVVLLVGTPKLNFIGAAEVAGVVVEDEEKADVPDVGAPNGLDVEGAPSCLGALNEKAFEELAAGLGGSFVVGAEGA